jgi:hypothetical protein
LAAVVLAMTLVLFVVLVVMLGFVYKLYALVIATADVAPPPTAASADHDDDHGDGVDDEDEDGRVVSADIAAWWPRELASGGFWAMDAHHFTYGT